MFSAGTQYEDCTGNLTFKNFETSDVKFKFRMSNPKHFNAVPKVGILSANGEQQIESKSNWIIQVNMYIILELF